MYMNLIHVPIVAGYHTCSWSLVVSGDNVYDVYSSISTGVSFNLLCACESAASGST